MVPHIPLPRADRRAVQAMLNALGYDAGPTDGAFGRRTLDAIRSFERDQGLRADGVLDRATYDRLSAQHAARPDRSTPPDPVATPPAAVNPNPPDSTPPPVQAGLQPGTYRAVGRATRVGDWTGVAEITGRRLSLRIVFSGPGGEARLSCDTTLEADDSFACYMRTVPSHWDRRWARGTFPQVRVLPLGSFGGADFDFKPAN
ncbi:MAG: peptidoglycan-binding domain-containing protein [Pseudomonadota bacterium]